MDRENFNSWTKLLCGEIYSGPESLFGHRDSGFFVIYFYQRRNGVQNDFAELQKFFFTNYHIHSSFERVKKGFTIFFFIEGESYLYFLSRVN